MHACAILACKSQNRSGQGEHDPSRAEGRRFELQVVPADAVVAFVRHRIDVTNLSRNNRIVDAIALEGVGGPKSPGRRVSNCHSGTSQEEANQRYTTVSTRTSVTNASADGAGQECAAHDIEARRDRQFRPQASRNLYVSFLTDLHGRNSSIRRWQQSSRHPMPDQTAPRSRGARLPNLTAAARD